MSILCEEYSRGYSSWWKAATKTKAAMYPELESWASLLKTGLCSSYIKRRIGTPAIPAGLTGDRHQLWNSHQFITSLSPVVHANLHGKKLVTTGSDVTSLSPVRHQLCQVGWGMVGTKYFTLNLPWPFSFWSECQLNELISRCFYIRFLVALTIPSIGIKGWTRTSPCNAICQLYISRPKILNAP